ncbi:MAG: hypothetical protein MJZ20_08375 [Bacteroidaceae bacterium]|jgi:hypothetical protein|nr:hypothetical protein [Bacteroidaceae bacterium]
MAEFELSIYGNDDEILKTYETSKVRWGVLLQAAEMQDVIEEKNVVKQFEQIGDFVKKLFPDLTDEDLQKADYEDVVNTFKQLMNKANKIGAGSAKNA